MDTKIVDKKIENKLLQKWSKIVGRKLILKRKNYKNKTKNNKQLIIILYQCLKPVLDETIKLLEIKLNQNLIEKIKKTSDLQKKTNYQKKLIRILVRRFKKFPLEDEGFLPIDIQKLKKFNCVGGSLLFSRILSKARIKSYYGFAFRHAVNIVKLADGSFIYICTRANLKSTIDYQKEKEDNLKFNVIPINSEIITDKNTRIKYLILNQEEIPYRLVLLLPQKEHILSIIDNMETKFFLRVQNLLFPEIHKFQKENKLWKDEKKYLNSPKARKILRNKYLCCIQ